ncbi:MAG TPA: TetR family transcriptional regulator [Gaiellaceae bacterium]|nr:TetR family transcriptional regulator [Gaiellaceae bacterium]
MAETADRRPGTSERVLLAARELFYDEGYGVTVDAIAARAHVVKPTVYAHFRSKEALIEAVLRDADEEWFRDLDAELDRRAGDPIARLLAPFDLLVRDLPDANYHGCILVNSAATFHAEDHPAHSVLASHEQRMLDYFRRLGSEAQAADPDALARQLLLIYTGLKAHGLVDSTGAAAADARAAVRALIGR